MLASWGGGGGRSPQWHAWENAVLQNMRQTGHCPLPSSQYLAHTHLTLIYGFPLSYGFFGQPQQVDKNSALGICMFRDVARVLEFCAEAPWVGPVEFPPVLDCIPANDRA